MTGICMGGLGIGDQQGSPLARLISSAAGWWEADFGVLTTGAVPATNNTDAVTWINQGSGGFNFATIPGHGKWLAGIFGTAPGIRFDGTIPQGMMSSLALTLPCTTIVVGRMAGTLNARIFSSSTANWALGWISGEENIAYAGDFVGPGPAATTNTRCFAMTQTGALTTLYNKKVAQTPTSTIANTAPVNLEIGSNGFGEPSSCDVAMWGAFNRILTPAELSLAVDYLTPKYAVP